MAGPVPGHRARPCLLFLACVLALCLSCMPRGQGFVGHIGPTSRPNSCGLASTAVEAQGKARAGGSQRPIGSQIQKGNQKLLKEITNNTPGLARSSKPQGEGGGGIRLLWAPEPSERVDFALWFGPLPCFQVGTFRYCFCLSQTIVLTGFFLALAVAILGPEILMSPRRYG
ncbi:unnamed protein product [Symbiodinium natans]|uniref:Uncharacterized protein n=1 Tax=Symbiodinium natans TaxID=878477 RepID=A0A812V2E6_9DINO|nr:unnamed protein product [Symbiodinium natans]